MIPKSELTRSQVANLKKLATYLENLPEGYQHFGMAEYTSLMGEEAVDYGLNNGGLDRFDCGTVACAVGHGPSAGILMRRGRDTYNSWYGEAPCWDSYSGRFVTSNDVFNWLFGSDWAHVDNTHRGAAARIRYVLDRKELPDGFDYLSDPNIDHVQAYASYVVKGDAHIAKVPA